MDNKKFEKLIDLIINENEEQARELFHDIVVEKSREIYESIMMDEMMDDEEMEEDMGGQVGDLMDEISAEESGVTEAEDEDMDMIDSEEEVVDIEADDESAEEEEEHEELEDAVVRIEDKLDQLMAEFEEIMGKEDEESDEEEMDSEEDEEEMDSEEDEESEEEDEEEEMVSEGDDEEDLDEEVMEAITLKKVAVTHGDNGANTKSPALHEPRVKVAGVQPVRFSGHDESVPTSPKGPSNAYSKGETQVKHAGKWKNAPAQAGQDLEKAPKAHTAQASGVNTKSPINESKKVVKKVVKTGVKK